MTMRGSCLCGAVSFEIEGPLEKQPEACHCTQCRKQTTHFFAGVNVKRKDLRLTGEEWVSWYQSSANVRRGFCSVCGSVLFWHPTIPDYEYIAVGMGLFDGPTGTRFRKHTFVGSKGDYYDIDDGVPQSTEF